MFNHGFTQTSEIQILGVERNNREEIEIVGKIDTPAFNGVLARVPPSLGDTRGPNRARGAHPPSSRTSISTIRGSVLLGRRCGIF
jgi:hypothetical protein